MENHGQKRTADEQVDILDGANTLLFDIEGTTTPISFVKDKLFPYIRDNVATYLKNRFSDDECSADIDALRKQVAADKEAGVEGAEEIPASEEDNQDAVIAAVVANITSLMDRDSKDTALKQLQGHMWREAYKTKNVSGEVFEDVVPALRQWTDEGKKAYIYSSGSVEAQKLLFGYSDKGSLLELFSGFFDTTTGSKVEKDSYLAIAKSVGSNPDQIVFFTDLPEEATAAGEAGLKTVLVVREGNAPLSDEDKAKFYTISSFTELAPGDFIGSKRLDAENGEEKPADEENGKDVDEDVDDDLDDLDGEDGDDDAEAEAAAAEDDGDDA